MFTLILFGKQTKEETQSTLEEKSFGNFIFIKNAILYKNRMLGTMNQQCDKVIAHLMFVSPAICLLSRFQLINDVRQSFRGTSLELRGQVKITSTTSPLRLRSLFLSSSYSTLLVTCHVIFLLSSFYLISRHYGTCRH